MSLTFLAPAFLWTLLALPMVVLLHFIRARKRRTTVSSLFLWQQAKEMAQTRRRFAASWLLALQLLFVALAALALAQPSLQLSGRPDRILIIDASASMLAEDSDGVRLEKAVREANRLARSAGRAAVVRAGLDAVVVKPLTGDRGELRAALNTIRAGDREADLERAVSLAQGAAPNAQIHVLTDNEAPVGRNVIAEPVGGDGLNLGISTFDVSLGQAFVAVVSNHPRPQEVAVELLQDGRTVASTTMLIPAQGQATASFPVEGSGFFEARLNAPSWDALGLDNSAFAGRRALLAALNRSQAELERALEVIPELEYRVLDAADNAPGFDLRIEIGRPPEVLANNALYISPPDPLARFETVRGWDRSDSLLRFVDLSQAVVGIPSTPAPEGWEVLAQTGNLSPVLLRAEENGVSSVFLNVNPAQTDLVNRTAFPLLLANIVGSFRDESRLTLGQPLPEGSVLLNGRSEEPVSEVSGPGLYQVNGETLSASLLSAPESRLPAGNPEAGVSGRGVVGSDRVRSAAPWLIGIACLALLAEWLLWSRERGRWRFGLSA